MNLPATHRALVVRDVNVEPKVESIPIPECLPGTVLLKVLASPVISYTKDIFLGNARKYTFPLPIIPGTSCIGRVAALPIDATSSEFSVGTLVFFNCTVRSRTNDTSGSAVYLQGLHDGHSSTSKALMANGGCKDGSYAEFVRVPTENIYVLDESILLGTPASSKLNLGYSTSELCHISKFLVPYGGLRSINLLAGQSILVGPATGQFGGAAVMLALSLGAKVVAWGRSEAKMDTLKTNIESSRNSRFQSMFESVVFVNDSEKDVQTAIGANSAKKFDAAFDISPPAAAGSSYIKSGILSLRHGGCISLMGGIAGDVGIPHGFVMNNDITIQGKWMYDREDVLLFVQLVERGILRLDDIGAGLEITGTFELQDWLAAWNMASTIEGAGQTVVISPGL